MHKPVAFATGLNGGSARICAMTESSNIAHSDERGTNFICI